MLSISPEMDNETEKPSRHFLKRLYDELKESGDLSLDSFQAAVRKARASAGGTAKAAKSKVAAESLTDFIDKVQNALYNSFRNRMGESEFSYAREVFADHVIACSNLDGKDYQIPFSTVNDEIAFGEPVEVEIEYVVIGATESHEVADLCADGRGMRLFIEQNFAEPPDWINYLPKPGSYTSPRYGTITITKDRNENFVSNFENKVYQQQLPITIDAEHETKLSGAMGWFEAMRVNDDGSVDAKVSWTDRGTSLIAEDAYKYFSPEWFEKWTDPATGTTYNDVAIGGALTVRPFFKEKALRPLVASEDGLAEVNDFDPKNLNSESVVILKFTALSPVENSKEIDTTMPDKETPSADDSKGILAQLKELIAGAPTKAAEQPKTDEGVTPQAFSELQSRVEAAEKDSKAKDDLLVKAAERITSLEKDARTKRFSELSKDWAGDKTKHVSMLEHLAIFDEKGEESEMFKDYVTTQNATAEQLKAAGLFSEVGSSSIMTEGSAGATLESKARKMSEDSAGKLTYEQAYAEVLRSDPILAREVDREERQRIN